MSCFSTTILDKRSELIISTLISLSIYDTEESNFTSFQRIVRTLLGFRAIKIKQNL